ncbi:hypothetical protein [Mucilaginibacter aquaedulcis]|uniref:hypothetical protein n=1 Tax=Mucilaginibacter aquaedulcis TaxID=1187081 RepID=UPI0025B3776C|nr:hypothetical protein [Mucilaginibacter aquaedulcis]MDN3548788.1 hypothetical protein [Mucilaginibacter aquaedulcis]
MKSTLKLLSAAVIFILSMTCLNVKVNAQTISKGVFRMGIGADGLVPVGDLKNAVNFGLGVTPRLQYGLTKDLALTFTTGYYHFFTKDIYIQDGLGAGLPIENSLEIIPVKAGLKAFVIPNFYIAGEIGLGLEVQDGGGPADLLLSPGFGYASKHWDFGARYENLSEQGHSVGMFGLRVAYGFGL